ncbi:hypothetical protein [Lactiplantibacillus plantarum]|uniref:hypothetical protein n=1 Tax=Lactiplantibacillus plantarum TaxID=1590 RepID=UPI000DAD090B|nr:hypothetical protein [Lactiplantibacillus plantarum]KAF1281542.1 hypothetical protein CHF38_14605 [Lactiplantibacillus plantarum]RAH93890.1 hypothetical protein DAY22_14605 [Lactiplantibacillus plantarum]
MTKSSYKHCIFPGCKKEPFNTQKSFSAEKFLCGEHVRKSKQDSKKVLTAGGTLISLIVASTLKNKFKN